LANSTQKNSQVASKYKKKKSKKKEKTEKIWRGLQLNWLKVRKGQPAQQQK